MSDLEYGFQGDPDDAFKELAKEKGASVLGKPLFNARYGDFDKQGEATSAYQVCENGELKSWKDDNGVWGKGYFLPFG